MAAALVVENTAEGEGGPVNKTRAIPSKLRRNFPDLSQTMAACAAERG